MVGVQAGLVWRSRWFYLCLPGTGCGIPPAPLDVLLPCSASLSSATLTIASQLLAYVLVAELALVATENHCNSLGW